jgi:hypothetical protein
MIDQSTLAQVDQKAAQYMGNPEALQQMYQQKQQLIDLLALQKIKSEKEAAARDMALKMAQQSGQPQTIAQQREQQVLDMTKQEMVQQQAGNLGHQQQEQQQNLQQVLKGMSQGAQQPPQQGTPGVPQQSAPGIAALPTQGLMPPKAMASGGIVAFDGGGFAKGSDAADWEEEWKRRQAELEDPNRSTSWVERNIVDRKQQSYDQSKRRAANELYKEHQRTAPGINTPTTKAERAAYEAKEAIIKNLAEGKYDPTGKPLVPTVGGKPATQVAPKAPVPETQAPAAAENPLQKVLDKNKLTPQQPRQAAPVLAPQAPQVPGASPAGGLQGIMEEAAKKQVGRDPVAEAKAKRAEAAAALGYTPEEQAKFKANQEGLEALNKEQFDPEKLRQEQLEDFLLGGAGHSTMGITLGSAGKAGVSRKRQQDALKYARMGELAKRGEDFLEKGRATREKGFELGEKSAESAEAGSRQGLASGTAMVDADKQMEVAGLDRASREKIANIQASVQREVNKATKEGTLELKRQTFMLAIKEAEAKAVEEAKKGSTDSNLLKQLSNFEAMGKLSPEQQATKKAAEARLAVVEKAALNGFADLRAQVMSENSTEGLGSLATGAFKVTPINTPIKK